MKNLMLCLLLVAAVFAAPKNYTILKLPSGAAPVIDGVLSEWDDAYLIDTLYSDDNCLARDGETPWSPAEFQMKVYAAYDDEKVYFGIEVMNDDNYIIGSGWSADNMKINPGGQAMAFYLNSDESSPVMNPSSPFQLGTTLWAGSKTHGAGTLPTYEFAAARSVYDPFEMGSFQASVGTEDMDIGNQEFFLGLGVEYKGGKHDWNGSAWDNTQYYPTYNLVPTVGPKLGNYHLGREAYVPSVANHVFWYKCIQKNYAITDTPGPALPANTIKHEGMIMSATLRASAGNQDPGFAFGSGLDDIQGRIACFWSKDLMELSGTVRSAKIRTEYRDNWSFTPFCNAGPIHLRVGVVDFQGNVEQWGAPENVAEDAIWMDPLNPFTGAMGYDMNTTVLQAETLFTFTAPAGRTSETGMPVLDSQFVEINVTKQVNWILAHTGGNKGSLSGQYGIVLLCKPGEGSTGRVITYADETCLGLQAVPSSWTRDGNSLHLFVNGSLRGAGVADKTPPVISNFRITPATDTSFSAFCSTNETAICRVIYGTLGAYPYSTAFSSYGVSHYLTLAGLAPQTAYNCKIVAQDLAGNTDTSLAVVCTTGTGGNRAPVFTLVSPQDTVITEPAMIRVFVHATDPDAGDSITYFWFVNDSFIYSGPNATECGFNAGRTSTGVDSVKIIAFDGRAQTTAWVVSRLQINSIPPLVLLPVNGTRVSDDTLLAWMPSPDLNLKGTKRFKLQFSSTSYFQDTLGTMDSVAGSVIAMKNVRCASRLPKTSIVFWRLQEFDSLGHRTGWSSGLNYFIFMGVKTIAVEDTVADALPTEFGLSQNQPNPFNPTTVIRYAVPRDRPLTIKVFDTKGQCVRTLIDGLQKTGYHSVVFDGKSQDGKALSSGLYLYRMDSEGFAKTRTFILMK